VLVKDLARSFHFLPQIAVPIPKADLGALEEAGVKSAFVVNMEPGKERAHYKPRIQYKAFSRKIFRRTVSGSFRPRTFLPS
jgi:hypothetical protein